MSCQVHAADSPIGPQSLTDAVRLYGQTENSAKGRPVVRDHRKLRAFELADQLALAVYLETRALPKEELYGLTSQIRRAAVSVPSNIVEGCAWNTEVDYLRFLDTAYGSARELEYQISLATRLGLLTDAAASRLALMNEETGKVLHGLIRSMRTSSRPQKFAAAGRSA